MEKIHIDSLGFFTAKEEATMLAHIRAGGHITGRHLSEVFIGRLQATLTHEGTVFQCRPEGSPAAFDLNGCSLYLCESREAARNQHRVLFYVGDA